MKHHLETANGYLELGMLMEAWDELERMDAKERDGIESIKIRVKIFKEMEQWELMAELAWYLSTVEPDEVGHTLDFAFAACRFYGVEVAGNILEEAQERFPKEALVFYNLACYRAALGRTVDARELLNKALTLNASLRNNALRNPDLEVFWSELNEDL